MLALRLILSLTTLWLSPANLLAAEAVDVSLSVDQQSYQLQREGYAQAFTDPRVLSAIRSGPSGRIAVCFFEWASTDTQNVIIDWMLIDGVQIAQQLSERLLELPRSGSGLTSISSAIDFAVAQCPAAIALLLPTPAGAQSSEDVCSVTETIQLQPASFRDLIAWIVTKTGWATEEPPLICFVSFGQLRKIYYGNGDASNDLQIHALYSVETHKVYLLENWNPDDLHDRAALLQHIDSRTKPRGQLLQGMGWHAVSQLASTTTPNQTCVCGKSHY